MNHLIYEEKRCHSSLYVPYSYYQCIIPVYYPYVPLHWHNEFEINFVHEGSGIFKCDQSTFTVNQGDIIAVLPNRLHAITSVNDSKLVYDTIVFNQSMLCGNADDRCYAVCLSNLFAEDTVANMPITASSPHYSEIRASVENMMTCAKENSGMMDLLLKSELMRTFWLLINSGSILYGDYNQTVSDKNIKDTIEYIKDHYNTGLSVKSLAQNVHLSESYFMGKFRRVTGMGVIEYVNIIRIKAACGLLVNSDFSSAQIAFEVGFRNLSNFNRQFKKIVGHSPREYRKAMQSHWPLG